MDNTASLDRAHFGQHSGARMEVESNGRRKKCAYNYSLPIFKMPD